MSSYKLTYFNSKGIAEPTRLLFALAEQKYEDVRVEKEAWPEMKPNTPFGQLPLLEVDGMQICDSRAIERLVAKRFGLYGETDLEQAKSDMVIGCLNDMIKPLLKTYEAEESKKPELLETYMKETAPVHFGYIEKMINENGFINGDKISWPDLALFHFVTIISFFGKDTSPILKDNKKVTKLKENVENNPKIAAWIEKRPKTDH